MLEMTEINITRFVENADFFEFSASIAERGPNAGRETWNNAKREGAEQPLLTTPTELAALRQHMAEYGAWEAKEIEGWTDAECNALFMQLISGDLREAGLDCVPPDEFDWDEYEGNQHTGAMSRNLYRGDDGQIYYSLST